MQLLQDFRSFRYQDYVFPNRTRLQHLVRFSIELIYSFKFLINLKGLISSGSNKSLLSPLFQAINCIHNIKFKKLDHILMEKQKKKEIPLVVDLSHLCCTILQCLQVDSNSENQLKISCGILAVTLLSLPCLFAQLSFYNLENKINLMLSKPFST